MPERISLDELVIGAARGLLSGRDRGEAARRRYAIDRKDANEDPITLFVSSRVMAIGASFFLGFLGHSVRRLGEAKFRVKYLFEGDAWEEVVERGIREALRERTAL